MDRQYVVEFECGAPAESDYRPLDQVIRAEEDWLDWMLGGSNSVMCGALTQEHRFGLEETHKAMRHRVDHEYRETTRSRSSLLRVSKDLSEGSLAHMIVEVSAIEELRDGAKPRTHLRLAMGRETDGLITPTNLSRLRRPGLFHNLQRQGVSLRVASTNQPVDGRYDHVGGEAELEIVRESLQKDRRLPIILVGMSGDSYSFASQLARETIGLAQVCTISRYLVPRMDSVLREDLAGGARLEEGGVSVIWPGVATVSRHPRFVPPYGEHVLGSIMGLLGPLSAVASRPDWLKVQALRDAELDRRAEREARIRTSLRSELQALDQNQGKLDEWVEYIEEVEAERDAALSENQRLESEAAALRYAVSAMQKSEIMRQEQDSLDEAPDLSADDLTPFADYLRRASNGHLAFTDEALRSWKQSTYTDAEKMSLHLVLLAKASMKYSEFEAEQGMMVDDWFRDQGLPMSATDGGLKKRKLHLFTWEGKEYSRLPHIQVNDRTNFEDVARIYFAIDRDNDRFLVDHVGGKLYNPYVNKR